VFIITLYWLILYVVALFESLYSSQSVNYPLLASVEWVAIAAYFDSEFLLGRAGGESVTAKASYLSVSIVFRMDFVFHYKRSPFFYI